MLALSKKPPLLQLRSSTSLVCPLNSRTGSDAKTLRLGSRLLPVLGAGLPLTELGADPPPVTEPRLEPRLLELPPARPPEAGKSPSPLCACICAISKRARADVTSLARATAESST